MAMSKCEVEVMMLETSLSLFVSIVATYTTSLMLINIERKHGILCKDAHKPYEYFVPCIGGFPLYTGIIVGLGMLYLFNVVGYRTLISSILVLSVGLLIGFMDDIFGLRSRWKILLGLFPALPMIIMGCYSPRPWTPFIGHTRLYLVYPVLMLIASTVYLNGVNMIDTHNGLLPMFAFTATFFALILKIVTGFSIEEMMLSILFAATLLIYLMFNMYPAKIFNGNTGAFLIGSMLFLVLVFARVEFYMILTSIPMFLNGFYYISSVKGFLQKEQVARPTYVDENGCIHPTKSTHPITFVKLVLALGGRPLSEKELIKVLYLVYITTSLASFLLCYLLGYS